MLGALVLSMGFAHGDGLEVSPVTLELLAGQRATTLTLTNHNPDPVSIQVRPFEWTQAAGQENLAATTRLAVSPPIFELAPEQAQTVRLVLRELPSQSEATYRLLVDQLPSANSAGMVSFALRLSLPVFVPPPQPVTARLEWSLVQSETGATLSVTNAGGRRTRVMGAELSRPGAAGITVATQASPYVLAGARGEWALDSAHTLHVGELVTVVANVDGTPREARVPVTAPP